MTAYGLWVIGRDVGCMRYRVHEAATLVNSHSSCATGRFGVKQSAGDS